MSATSPRGPAGDLAARKRALVAQLLERKGLGAQPRESIPRRSRQDEWPLSFAQRRLWFLERLEPGTPRYNTFTALRVEGPLDADALARSLAEILARHEALRGLVTEVGGEPVQRIGPAGAVSLPVVELGEDDEARGEEALRRLAAEEARRPFDLERGPLLRATLVRLAPERHVLLLSLHHVVSDGWAIGVLLGELATLYTALREGRPSPLLPLPLQYADFAAWQRQRLQGEVLERELDYWRRQLDGVETLALPTDRPRPPVQSLAGAWCGRQLDDALAARLRGACREEGVTAFVALLAAFQALLELWTGQGDVTVGSPVAGRDRAELEPLVGFFANMLVLRTDLSDDPTFRELLRRVRGVVSGALAHQEVPFDRLVEELRPERELSRHPLFQVAFAVQHAPQAALTVPGGTWVPAGIDNGVAKFDLTLYVSERAGTLTAAFEHSTELFDRPTVERLLVLYERLLEAALAAPDTPLSALSLLPADDERRLLEASHGAAAGPTRAVPVHEQFAARVREAPDALAIQAGGEALAYGALDRRANRLARHLVTLGVGPEVRVAVCMERSLDLVVALLGVLKAGGAYLPLDPGYPAERLRFMLEDGGVRVLLTQDRLRAALPPTAASVVSLDGGWGVIARQEETRPAVAVDPAQLAYVIYTSGSTGRAKGVEVPHGALSNLVAWHRRAHEVTPADRATMLASLSFDASVWELWPYLASGASVHLAPDEDLRSSPARVVEWLARSGITLGFLPTPLAEAVLRERLPESLRLRALLTGGDTLHAIPSRLPFRLLNHYGPTEAAVVSTWTEVAPNGPAAPPIGRAIDGTEAYVLDRGLRLAPVGVAGELYVGGAGLARGYRGRPDLTAASFVPNAHATAPGERLYRTGDRAVRLADGRLAFLGRLDEQVKVRGFRIEPGEIEVALAGQPGVKEAAVVAREDAGAAKQLVAYVAREDGADVSEARLRTALAALLPAYMVPSAFVFLDALPVSPNGKIDRRALPAPPRSPAGAEPRSVAERAVAAVWREVLGAPRVTADDDFFALGGHSLLAARVVAALRDRSGVELPLRAVFESPTLESLAARVEAALAERSADPGRLDGDSAGPAVPALRRRPRGDGLPLSFAQQRLWVLDQLGAGAAYNVSLATRLSGRLDVPALSRSLLEIARRHESLRTTFETVDGQLVQSIAPRPDLRPSVVDLRDGDDGAREPEARRLADEEARRPFDLARGPLVRATLLVLGEEEHVLVLTLHHIVADGWSMGVFTRELAALYRSATAGTAPALPDPPLQYADYAAWQREWLSGDVLDGQVAYWRRQLDRVAPLRLPLDRPRPATQTFTGASVSWVLPPDLHLALLALGREHGVTLFMVLLAGFQALLHRCSGQDDVAVGSPMANRGRPELEDVIGLFVNTIVMRADFSDDPSFEDLLARVKSTALAAYAHQDLPFDVLVEELGVARDASRNPLVQAVFALQNAPAAPLDLPGLELRPQPLSTSVTHFDLEMHVQETQGGLAAAIVYNADLLESSTVERMSRQYARLLESAVERPLSRVSALSLVGEEERSQLVSGWSTAVRDYPRGKCVHELFAEQARRRPEAVAVVDAGGSLSYGELDRRANRVACRLRELGVGPESAVGLCVERSRDLVVGMLGILKAGGGYVPLDPGYPRERLGFMVEDAELGVVITQGALRNRLPEDVSVVVGMEELGGEEVSGPDGAVDPGQLAYVIYTSGSTGRPKGVGVSHGAISRLVLGTDYVSLDETDVVGQASNASFDAATFEVWGALLNGARLFVVGREAALSPEGLGGEIERQGITVLFLTTALFNRVAMQAPWAFSRLRTLLFGGEAVDPRWVREVLERGRPGRLLHVYGPTENTTFSTWELVEEVVEGARTVPIGGPIANSTASVLDSRLEPVPVGVVGELYVGGEGLARGYVGRPGLTAERFVPSPFGEGERLYRTGDRARRRPGGAIEFLGRSDHQVKLRGFRIELGEIESALFEHPGVRDCVVLAREDRTGERRLSAYVVPHALAGESAGDAAPLLSAPLRERLQANLPDYMVPSTFVFLDALPLSPNGKVDRRALPEPAPAVGGAEGVIVPPRTPVEEAVAAVWCEVLALERVSVHDNFFDLGGHSLRLVEVHRRLRARFPEPELPVVELFRYPTVASLAARLSGSADEPRPRAGAAESPKAGRERLERRRGLRGAPRGGEDADA